MHAPPPDPPASPDPRARVLLLDNHDSYTFNLFQQLARLLGEDPVVLPHDAPWAALEACAPEAVVISPGPGHPAVPDDFGVCAAVLRAGRWPVLGVCLGHQGLAVAFGGEVGRAPAPCHGVQSRVRHEGVGLFSGIPQDFLAVRYHSLAVLDPVPAPLVVTARAEDGVIMGLAHRERPLWGVQFHPESICTEHGDRLIENFLRMVGLSARTPTPTGPTRARVGPARHPPTARRPSETGFRRLDRALDPESVFLALYADASNAFWLDSGRPEGSPPDPEQGRYSYLGAVDATRGAVLRERDGVLELTEAGHTRALPGAPLDALQAELDRRARRLDPALPVPFQGGFVGALGYELLSEHPPPPDQPRLLGLLIDDFIAFDHVDRVTWLVGHPAWCAAMEARLEAIDLGDPPADPPSPGDAPAPRFRLALDRAAYLDRIAACDDALRRGDSYELCLTNRLEGPPLRRPLDTWRVLRRRNPAPYGAFLRIGDVSMLCASPELFLRLDADGRITSRPIKGTAARDADPAADVAARNTLAASEKNRSENLMIVDLLRNDLGRVSVPGTVTVPGLMEVEAHPTVHQMVSTVCGQLRPGATALDLVRAAFPGGSMTGAPKPRTMRILRELEAGPRGLYAGALGTIGWSGCLNLNIVIRTVVCTPHRTTVGVGGAIVVLSDPQEEFAEILLKGRALLEAMALSESGGVGYTIEGA